MFFVYSILLACGINPDTKKKSEKISSGPETTDKLKGRWIEETDSTSIIEFTEKELIVYYDSTEVNRYEFTLFNGLPGEGGYEAVSGRVIQIEESKDNFHHFKIVILDSNYLELEHRGSVQTKFYKRLKN